MKLFKLSILVLLALLFTGCHYHHPHHAYYPTYNNYSAPVVYEYVPVMRTTCSPYHYCN